MHETEQNRLHRLVVSLLDAWNHHDLDRFVGYFSPDYAGVDVNDPAPQQGLADLRESAERYLQAFPDLHTSCDAVLAEGTQVAVQWTARGTHLGPFMHIPPTRRPVEIRGMALFSIEDGAIRRGLVVWDTAGVLRTLGLLPQLAPRKAPDAVSRI